MMIGAAEVRRLLESGDPEASLVLHQGKAEVVTAEDVSAGRYLGALPVASRQEVIGMLDGRDPSGPRLDQLAAALDAAVTNLGG